MHLTWFSSTENMPEANFHHASKRALILTTESAKWPNAEVPYTFESDFSKSCYNFKHLLWQNWEQLHYASGCGYCM